MIKRTLYFGNSAYLSLKDGQLIVRLPEVVSNDTLSASFKNDAQAKIPIEDIGIVVLDNKQITLTHGVIDALQQNNVALISCDSTHHPVGLMLPLNGNTLQNERYRAQLEVSEPLRKQIWQHTIIQKIKNQAHVLKQNGGDDKYLISLSQKVKSGDSDNAEAIAAAHYWANIFTNLPSSVRFNSDQSFSQGEVEGKQQSESAPLSLGEGSGVRRIGQSNTHPTEGKQSETAPRSFREGSVRFTRHREGAPPNNYLNYGYSLLRATMARSIVSAGLLPTLGIHHANRYNAYCLADDLMEPYRPWVDALVIDIINSQGLQVDLTKEIKTALLIIPVLDVMLDGETSPLMNATQRTAVSIYKCFTGEQRKPLYPEFAKPNQSSLNV